METRRFSVLPTTIAGPSQLEGLEHPDKLICEVYTDCSWPQSVESSRGCDANISLLKGACLLATNVPSLDSVLLLIWYSVYSLPYFNSSVDFSLYLSLTQVYIHISMIYIFPLSISGRDFYILSLSFPKITIRAFTLIIIYSRSQSKWMLLTMSELS